MPSTVMAHLQAERLEESCTSRKDLDGSGVTHLQRKIETETSVKTYTA